MLYEYTEKTALKITGMRYNYVQFVNKLLNMMQYYEDEYSQSSSTFTPAISYRVKCILEDRLAIVRRKIVDSMVMELKEFAAKPIDLSILKTKKNKRFPMSVIQILNSAIQRNKYPSEAERILIARQCKISTKQVNNWFTNKRNRDRNRKKDSGDSSLDRY
ncbi:hypothetical protein PAPHI01_0399 [Pancytospora philotis]|nr:hypothetical protein PAPHI01_0399 [Pancytospora philotis]